MLVKPTPVSNVPVICELPLADLGYQTPPPIPRKIYSPVPPVPRTKSQAKTKVSAKGTKPDKSNKSPTNGVTKLDPDTSKAAVAHSAQRHGTPPPIIIVISSDDDSARPTLPAERGEKSDIAPSSVPRIARSRRDPPKLRPLRAPPARPSNDDSDIIDVTRSDSDNDGPLPETQPRASTLPSTSRQVTDAARPAHTDRNKVLRAPSRATHPPSPRGSSVATRPRVEVSRAPSFPRPRPVGSDNASSIDDATTSESDDDEPPPSTQPRITSSRAVVRSCAPSREMPAHTHPAHDDSEDSGNDSAPPETQLSGIRSRDLQAHTYPLLIAANRLQDASQAGSSNKENDDSNAERSCLDFQRFARLSARQAAARRYPAVFTSLAQTSSSSNKNRSDNEADQNSDATVRPVSRVQSGPEDAGERVDAAEAFGDPFRFELYPAIPGLITSINPYTEPKHWILTIKIWYKVRLLPCDTLSDY